MKPKVCRTGNELASCEQQVGLPSTRRFEELGGTADLIRSFCVSDFAMVSADQTDNLVAASALQNGREAILLDYAISWGGDWANGGGGFPTVISVATIPVGVPGNNSARSVAKNHKWLGPFRRAVGSMGQPLSLRPHGLFARVGQDFAIIINSGEGAPMEGQGYLFGYSWSETQAREARTLLREAGINVLAPWPKGAVFGGS